VIPKYLNDKVDLLVVFMNSIVCGPYFVKFESDFDRQDEPDQNSAPLSFPVCFPVRKTYLPHLLIVFAWDVPLLCRISVWKSGATREMFSVLRGTHIHRSGIQSGRKGLLTRNIFGNPLPG